MLLIFCGPFSAQLFNKMDNFVPIISSFISSKVDQLASGKQTDIDCTPHYTASVYTHEYRLCTLQYRRAAVTQQQQLATLKA